MATDAEQARPQPQQLLAQMVIEVDDVDTPNDGNIGDMMASETPCINANDCSLSLNEGGQSNERTILGMGATVDEGLDVVGEYVAMERIDDKRPEIKRNVEEEKKTDGLFSDSAPDEFATRPANPARAQEDSDDNDGVDVVMCTAGSTLSGATDPGIRSSRRTRSREEKSKQSLRGISDDVTDEVETNKVGSRHKEATRKRKAASSESSMPENVIEIQSDKDNEELEPSKKAKASNTTPVSKGHKGKKAETTDTSSTGKTTGKSTPRKSNLGKNANAASNGHAKGAPSSNGKKPQSMRRSKITTDEAPSNPYVYKEDPNQYYIEEEAHIYHNPPFPTYCSSGVLPKDLRPIPPPPPLPTLPDTGSCRWSFDEDSRVLLAEFRRQSSTEQLLMDPVDSKFLFEMFERDDITVISRGLVNLTRIDPSVWNLDHITQVIGREFYHKIRRFDRTVDNEGFESFSEVDKLYSMRFEDYGRYCEQRMAHVEAERLNIASPEELTFSFVDHLDIEHSINVETTALYMIDVDIKRSMPWLYANFLESFEMPHLLPGGSHCMMNSITPNARPFMGPNLYITPPASFTHFHQDGHGTVDSGHLCISGYNEVVILRRLTERHKKHALWILTGNPKDESSPNPRVFDGLYSEPHGDGLGEKPRWPSNEKIRECKRMGYCPSVLILKPGDLIHINKGRLHAFRKMSTFTLRSDDCHAKQRLNLIANDKIEGEHLCISVAWDWMYRGVSVAGINREMLTILEAAILNRKNAVTSLAVPELSLLQMAKTFRTKTPNPRQSFLTRLPLESGKPEVMYDASKHEICQGILPCLTYVVSEHVGSLVAAAESATEAAEEAAVFEPGMTTSYARGERLSLARRTDTQENPMTFPLDPYGDSDFACKLCRKELSNVYYHCDGCEILLSKDFNICKDCHTEKKYMVTVLMHPSNPRKHAALTHTGDMAFNRESKCPCKNGPRCKFCGFCLGCSCRCHTFFTVHTRFFKEQDERDLLENVKEKAGTLQEPICLQIKEPQSGSNVANEAACNIVEEPLNQESRQDVERMTQLALERLHLARGLRDDLSLAKKSLR